MEQVSEFVFMFMMGFIFLANTICAEKDLNEHIFLGLLRLCISAFILALMFMVKS